MKKILLSFAFGLGSLFCNAQSGAALNFDGVDDYVAMNNSISSVLDPLNTITVEAWVNSSNTVFNGVIVGNYYTSSSDMQFLLRRDGDSYTFWVDDENGFEMVGSAAGSVITNTWQHVAGVWDGSSLYLYINGVLVATTTGVNGPSFASVLNPVVIGRNLYPESFEGSIDEVRIWNVARTQCQINTYKDCEIPGSMVGLLANYHFNQGLASQSNASETVLTDASGNFHNGNLNNFSLAGSTSNWMAPSAVVSNFTTTATSSFCPPAAALNFDGVDNYVDLGTPANLPVGNSAYTIEAKIKPTVLGVEGIVGWGDYGNIGKVNALRLDPSGNIVNYWWGPDLAVSASPINLLDGNWHHISATFDGTIRSIYVDGILKGSDTPGSSHTVPAMNVRIGSTCTNCGGEYFNGGIDEVRIWNVSRSQCDVVSYMNCEIPSTETGLVANYHFNQGLDGTNNSTVTTLVDASGNLNNGTLNNFALQGTSSNWIASGGVVSGNVTPSTCTLASALNFDGVNDYAELIALPSMSDMTIETWIYPESNGNFAAIMNQTGWSTGHVHFQLLAGGELGFAVNGNYPEDLITSMTFTLNQWHHIAAVYSATNNYLKLYANGNLIHSFAYTTANPTSANTPLMFGGWDGQRFFDGYMDEMRIWNTARTECEIKTYMNSEIPSTAIGLVANYHFNQGYAGFSNSSESAISDASGNSNNATLNNFSLNGPESNFVAPGAVAYGYTTTTITAPTVGIVTSNAEFCLGGSTTLSGTGADAYVWEGTVTDGASFSPTTTATYTVTGTNTVTTCSNTALSTVTVNALPNITVNSNAICAGQSFTMLPNGAVTYTYSNGSDVTTPTADETYTVTGTDINGCENMATSSVTVNALPVLAATTTNTLMCSGETVTLSVTGAMSYTWNTTETTADIVVSPTVQTTYAVDGLDGNGCLNTISITQDVGLCTGIAQLEKTSSVGLNIYPNPSNGVLTVQFENWNSEITIITITNAIGQVVLNEYTSSQNVSFNLSSVSAGIYILKAENKGITKKVRFIKQ
jgi:hypothetical protein